MSEPGDTISLEKRRFSVPVLFRDPLSKSEYEFDCIIDTGNPDAIALPESHSDRFSRHLGKDERGGAGIGECDIYAVQIVELGELHLSHTTMGYMSLPSGYQHGLIGMDFLRYMLSEIYDDPDDKKIDLIAEYL